MTQKIFRQSVVGLFVNESGNILLGERSDAPGAWQLPQGGVDAGETPEAALRREMHEELGSVEFRIIKRAGETCRYEFPANLDSHVARKYLGQEQTWFLVQFDQNAGPDLAKSDKEFRAFRWAAPSTVLEEIIDWKRTCYEKGFKQLGIQIS